MQNSAELVQRPTILVVDDTPDNLLVMSGLLKAIYKVKVANSGERALKSVREDRPDLILLDIMMPGMSGYDVLRALRADPSTRAIPVIFLTAMSTAEDEKTGLEMGAADYITKPISPPIVLARVKTQLENKAAADFLRDQNAYLEAEVGKRTREISAIQDVTILAMASMAETRDSETGNHIRRTQHYVRILAEKIKTHPRFGYFLSEQTIELLFKSAPLHDIGKVGIPDRILLKPGRFTPEEFEIMKTHTTLGRDAIAQAEDSSACRSSSCSSPRRSPTATRKNGTAADTRKGWQAMPSPYRRRLMAVADVYDALISRRVYKDGMPHEKAVGIMREGRGTHFDPDILDAFLELEEEFRAIATRFADGDADMAAKARQLEQSQVSPAAAAGT